jgi:hypothetical protein
VGFSEDFRKGFVCTVKGNKDWRQSSTIAAPNGSTVKVNRDTIKALNAVSCAP